MRRLHVQFYLAILAALVVITVASGLFWRFSDERNSRALSLGTAAELAQLLLPPASASPAEQQRTIDTLHRRLQMDLALFDREGRLLAIFLYMPDVKIYPPQMNHVHSYFIGGDSDTLLRHGRWNDELARQWLAEADYIMLQNTEKVYLTDEMLESGEYVRVMSAPRAEKCRWQSVIQVYQRADAR